MTSKYNLAIVVPTIYSRAECLSKAIDSLGKSQNIQITIILVTAEHEKDFFLIHELLSNRNFRFFHLSSGVMGAADQRNVALHFLNYHLNHNLDYIFFMDDDILISLEQLSILINNLNRFNADGISGVTNNYKTIEFRILNFFRSMFLLSSTKPGKVTKFGINVEPFGKDIFQVQWLIACSVWKYTAIQGHYFFSSFNGYTLGEDVIFSHKLFRTGKMLLVNSDVQFHHHEANRLVDEYNFKLRLLHSRFDIMSLYLAPSTAKIYFRIHLIIDFIVFSLRNFLSPTKICSFSKLYLKLFLKFSS